MDEKKKELIKKLQALAERGVGGEKEGAQRKLEQLMKKYNISEADLSDEQLHEHEWKYHTEFEKRLLRQTMYKVIGKDFTEHAYAYTWGRGSKSVLGLRCTDAQAIQIGIEYEFYCQTWKEEQEFFFKCFIQKHRIFQMNEDKKIQKDDEEELSWEESLRMQSAMNAMQDKSMLQRLEG